MRTRVLSIAVGALTTLALAGQTSPSTLSHVAKVGDEINYKFEAKLEVQGVVIELSGKTMQKVTKVNEDGTWSYQSSDSGVKVKTEDGEQELEEGAPTKVEMGSDRVITKYGDGGDEDASSIRLMLLETVKKPEKPIQVGDKWSATLTYKGKETVPVKAQYEAIALEKIGEWETMKVKVEASEAEGEVKASSSGFVWITLADGFSAKEELKISKAPFAFSPDPIDMSILITRVK
ncbi:MAG: hypothetical protein JNK63_06085 [Chthonomonas sp.]|nr:hypothetical protein [Chthonomonas sp.]